jgi:hypothetical protein
MDRRTRLVVLVLAVLLAITGATAFVLSGMDPTGEAPGDLPSVSGVVVGVDSAGLDDVRGFTLRTADGSTIAFTLGGLTNGVTFAPGHLVEHQATAQPVRVWYRTEGATQVAVRIEDAS